MAASDITVTGATKGALTGTGTTRNLAISDINVANGATVSVTVTSPAGFAITGSPQTAVVYIKPVTIGEAYRGGIIAYILQSGDTGYDVNVQHGLIAATADQSTGIVWITGGSTQTTFVNGVDDTGTSINYGTGQANTTAIIAQAVAAGNNTLSSYAAGLCDAYTNTETGTGVYTDWYLPSRDELNELYVNRAAVGSFTTNTYWSSSEYTSSASGAWWKNFSTGNQNGINKSSTYYVRAVRDF